MLDLKLTLWFDEHHCEAVVGTDGIKSETQTLFPHNKYGEIDLANGQYHDAKHKLKMKCNNKAWICTGCYWNEMEQNGGCPV
jgi:hypothetical protein